MKRFFFMDRSGRNNSKTFGMLKRHLRIIFGFCAAGWSGGWLASSRKAASRCQAYFHSLFAVQPGDRLRLAMLPDSDLALGFSDGPFILSGCPLICAAPFSPAVSKERYVQKLVFRRYRTCGLLGFSGAGRAECIRDLVRHRKDGYSGR